jgi:hypothetical protein
VRLETSYVAFIPSLPLAGTINRVRHLISSRSVSGLAAERLEFNGPFARTGEHIGILPARLAIETRLPNGQRFA